MRAWSGKKRLGSAMNHLIGKVQELREVLADVWAGTQLIRALHCRPRRNIFENEVAILIGE